MLCSHKARLWRQSLEKLRTDAQGSWAEPQIPSFAGAAHRHPRGEEPSHVTLSDCNLPSVSFRSGEGLYRTPASENDTRNSRKEVLSLSLASKSVRSSVSLKSSTSQQGGLPDLRVSVLPFDSLTGRGKDAFYLKPISSVQFSRSVVSDSLRPHESQHACDRRPPCPSPTPGVHSNSRPPSR